jgi:hypothetical protein
MQRVWVVALLIGGSLASLPSLAVTPLVVEAALDRQVVAPLLATFEQAHPGIELSYRDRSTLEVDRLVVAADPPPDVVISSAMPWQMNRINQGYAQRLDSELANAWPEWAKWRNEVFGFTFEPIVMAYRLDLARHMLPPHTHADLQRLLETQRDTLQGRVTTYSPSESGIGYTLFQQDARYTERFWDLVTVLPASRPGRVSHPLSVLRTGARGLWRFGCEAGRVSPRPFAVAGGYSASACGGPCVR